ncbi:Uridine-cytidine kinase 2 [Actinomortierella ambigua]|uniref:uridine/cytidine kinase n=1 Tax=Actinomortierella ambigua TaxID=1343610 RepID=A0A9P6U2T8_9FUNG|nr:Uridine-cytidine kinase 2 [Actinomortierella ambigua]
MSIQLPASFTFTLPQSKVFFIGLAGGADCGKEEVCRELISRLQKIRVVDSSKCLLLHLHNFYKELSEEDRVKVAAGLYNFDHPDALDWPLVAETLHSISGGKITRLPKFDFPTKQRKWEQVPEEAQSPTVVLFEGIFVLYEESIRDILNMKLFVDLDDDERLSNRVSRKVKEDNPDSVDHILTEYVRFVKPSFDKFVNPSKKWADIIVPRGVANIAAIDLIAEHAADLMSLKQRQESQSRSSLSASPSTSSLMSSSRASLLDLDRQSATSSPSALLSTQPDLAWSTSHERRKSDVLNATEKMYSPVPE